MGKQVINYDYSNYYYEGDEIVGLFESDGKIDYVIVRTLRDGMKRIASVMEESFVDTKTGFIILPYTKELLAKLNGLRASVPDETYRYHTDYYKIYEESEVDVFNNLVSYYDDLMMYKDLQRMRNLINTLYGEIPVYLYDNESRLYPTLWLHWIGMTRKQREMRRVRLYDAQQGEGIASLLFSIGMHVGKVEPFLQSLGISEYSAVGGNFYNVRIKRSLVDYIIIGKLGKVWLVDVIEDGDVVTADIVSYRGFGWYNSLT